MKIKILYSLFLVLLCCTVYAFTYSTGNKQKNISEQDSCALQATDKQKIQLFMYKDCYFCIKVVDFLKQHNLLDKVELLDATTLENKNILKAVSGKTQAPYLIDQSAGVKMPESLYIIAYITEKFLKSHEQKADVIKEPVVVHQEVTDFLEKIKKSEKPVIVLASASWCGPCRQFKPIFQEIAKQMQHACEFIILDVDVDTHVAEYLRIQYLPTLVCFKNGQRIDPTNWRTHDGLLKVIYEVLQK